mmetsp:Transcript_17894/g.34198  ORF Transcript_17894/g.34198 Transcript_17894/m.34198 type:complete len:675 (+) Transcript_17894:83-2107(+)
MSKRSEATRLENERVKRQTEQRLARKREKEMQAAGTDEEYQDDSEDKPSYPGPPRSQVALLRNINWTKVAMGAGVVFLVLGILMLSSTGKSTPKKSKTPEVGVDTSDILKEQEALASTPPEELEASAPVAVPPLVDKVVEEPHEEPLEEPQAKLQDSLPETEKNAPEELEPASLEATPSTNPSVAIVDKALLPSPMPPPVPNPPESPLAPPLTPESPPRASMRWANLRLPEQCFMFPSAPHGVLPGLEHYTFSKKPIVPELAAEAPAKPTETATKIDIIEKAADDIRADHDNVYKQSENEEDVGARMMEETAAEKREQAGLQAEADPVTHDNPVASLDAEEAGPADLESETRKLMLHRRLLGKPRKRPEVNAEVDPPQQASAPAQVPQTAGFKQNPHAATGEALMPSSTELKAMNLLLNVSVSDGTCQFLTKECAEVSAQLLAQALRADAEAVSNPQITAADLRRVTKNLAYMHANSRTMLNSTELPSLGANGDLGNCAIAGENEYNPETGMRYDAFTSRFAVAIDRHEVLVHCAEKHHYCTLTRLQGVPITETVRIDARSYLKAKEAGMQLHQLLAEDPELSDGVASWGHKEEPTHQFVTLMLLLRSGLCQRVDIYGQPGVPARWFQNLGNGHIVTMPNDDDMDRALAATLQQERYMLRVAMHVFGGRMCFYK